MERFPFMSCSATTIEARSIVIRNVFVLTSVLVSPFSFASPKAVTLCYATRSRTHLFTGW